MKAKSDLHAPMGRKEAAQDRDGVSPHTIAHPEKRDRIPRPASNGYHTDGSGVPIAPSPEVFDRMPGTPNGADGFVEHGEKTKTQGFADAKRARGHAYPESKVDTSDHSHGRSEHVPINEDAGSIGSSGGHGRMPNTRCKATCSSQGGKPPKA